MRIFLAVFLIGIIIISGCTSGGKTAVKTPGVNSALASICKGTGEAKAYTVDLDGTLLQKAEATLALNSKCNLFTRCDLDIEEESKKFKLYALNADNATEKKIFGNVDFKAYIGLHAEQDGNGDTVLAIKDKKYPVKYTSANDMEVAGKALKISESVNLDGINLKYYDFKDNSPIFQVFGFEGKDVVAVIDDPELTKVFPDPNGLGGYSILIQINDETASNIRELVKNSAVVLSIGPQGQQANLKSRIYYYGNQDLLASANLPAALKTDPDINQITIFGIFENPSVAVYQFEWLTNGLKLYTYPPIKILETEKYDCRDVEK